MDKKREDLINNFLREFFFTFRALKPEGFQKHSSFGDHLREKFGLRGQLKQGHFDLLFCLKKSEKGLSVNEIADSLHVTAGAVTQLVDKAIEMGLVTREVDSSDRRVQKVKLSGQARERIEKMRSKFVEQISPQIKELEDSEIAQLTTLLSKINKQ